MFAVLFYPCAYDYDLELTNFPFPDVADEYWSETTYNLHRANRYIDSDGLRAMPVWWSDPLYLDPYPF